MDLVLQREVEGEVFDALVVVDLHSGGVLVSLKVLDDVREPDRQAVVPAQSNTQKITLEIFLKILKKSLS